MNPNWAGLFPALWTPCGEDGRLLREDLAAQVKFLRAAGTDGLMVLGSTGEFAHLELSTRKEVLSVVAEAAPGWVLIANISDVSRRMVAELGRHARAVGAAAVALLPPWFYAATPADVVEFMVRGAESAGLPLLVYNFPERTGHRLSLETIAAVCDRVRVIALKQSGAEFEYHRELARLGAEKGFVLITGGDTRIGEAFALGARGAVSGLANAVPEWVTSTFRAAQSGDAQRTQTESAQLGEFAACVRGLEFPTDVAAAMKARGRPIGELKPVLSAASAERFSQAVGAARLILARRGLV